MSFLEHTGQPQPVSVNGAPPQTMKLHLETFKIDGDKGMKEYFDALAEGRDVLSQVQVNNVSYIVLRKLIPVKINLENSARHDLRP